MLKRILVLRSKGFRVDERRSLLTDQFAAVPCATRSSLDVCRNENRLDCLYTFSCARQNVSLHCRLQHLLSLLSIFDQFAFRLKPNSENCGFLRSCVIKLQVTDSVGRRSVVLDTCIRKRCLLFFIPECFKHRAYTRQTWLKTTTLATSHQEYSMVAAEPAEQSALRITPGRKLRCLALHSW